MKNWMQVAFRRQLVALFIFDINKRIYRYTMCIVSKMETPGGVSAYLHTGDSLQCNLQEKVSI